MKKVTLANNEGKAKEVNVVFSWPYLFFGPFYYFYKVMIVRGILLLLLYALMILPCFLPMIKPMFNDVSWMQNYLYLFDRIHDFCWYFVGGLVVLHILFAFLTPRAVTNKLFKKGYVPYCEIDTQMLIKHGLAKVGTQCYLSSFKAIDGVQGKIKIGNSKALAQEIDELKQLLKEGMITKDDYETRRAMAIMRSSNQKR